MLALKKLRRAHALRGLVSLIALSVMASVGTSEASEDLSGTWVLLQETTVKSSLVVTSIKTKTRTISLHPMKHTKGSLAGAGKNCFMQMQSDSSLAKPRMPAAFMKAMPVVPFRARLSSKGSEQKLKQPWQTVIVGSKLKRPAQDALPSEPEDPRVFDHDGDGHPGVTVEISGMASGELYFTQRTRSFLSGNKVKKGFRGGIHFTSELSVLGASNSLLKSSSGAKPVLSESRFRMEKVKAGMSCREAIALAQSW